MRHDAFSAENTGVGAVHMEHFPKSFPAKTLYRARIVIFFKETEFLVVANIVI
jgi:hypothetical protein